MGGALNDKQLRGFIATVQMGSFSKASEALYITPQALIKQVNQLENEVGARLLKRSPSGVVCTPAGQHFYENVLHLEDYLTKVIERCQELSETTTRKLRVGVLSTPLFMPELLFGFCQEHPEFTVTQLELDTAYDYHLLIDNDADVLEAGRFDTTFGTKDLLFTPLSHIELACVVAPTHRLAKMARVALSDLAGETVAVPNSGFYFRNGADDDVLRRINFEDKVFGRDKMMRACLNGSVYLMPAPAAVALRPLVSASLDFAPAEVGVYTRTAMSDDVRVFIEFAQSRMS